jgi:D-aminoacyl-tRNA deacylase
MRILAGLHQLLLVLLWLGNTATRTYSVHSMRLVIQRVHSASVSVEGQEVARIGPGILALVGLQHEDTLADLIDGCRQLVKAKLWDNNNGKPWKQSVVQKNYEILLVSQFTLYGTLSRSKYTPDYQHAMKSIPAHVLYETFYQLVAAELPPGRTQSGVFGAMMDVQLNNDGPVTLILESATPTAASTTRSDSNDNVQRGGEEEEEIDATTKANEKVE